jgi:hypothetical protein
MAQQNTYDLPIMVGAAIVGAIACGLFWYMRPEPVRPPAPTEPITTPLNAQAAPVTMVETNGSGKADQNQAVGGPAGAGPVAGKLGGAGGPAAPGRAN